MMDFVHSWLFIVFAVLISFQIKHVICKWLAPHPSTHWVGAGLTFMIVFSFTTRWEWSLLLAVVDFVVHYTMDRDKSSPTIEGRYKALQDGKHNWRTDVLNKLVRQITHYGFTYLVMLHKTNHGGHC